jgi:hypothetical protein
MTTATTFSLVSEAKESSKRSSVPEALGSVSNLAQQNFSHFPPCSSSHPQLPNNIVPSQDKHGEDDIAMLEQRM